MLAARRRSHLVVPWSRLMCRALLTLTVPRSILLLSFSSEFEVCGWFGWCVLKGFSQSGALVVLVEVLFRATVVLPLWFEVCRLVGPRSGEIVIVV
ncbi:hypothetical protein Taro_045850 [Colocasia esculenta]|uniref:Uncharacterized protein n=1 Tax=Colocasia esculenta TaxID=4460 RepID=A0A843X115_COLES|nr:hypothetical protein [Colocasia esculenta]